MGRIVGCDTLSMINYCSFKVLPVIWVWCLGCVVHWLITFSPVNCQQAGKLLNMFLMIHVLKHWPCFLLFRGAPPATYVPFPRASYYTMSSGSAQDVAVEHFLRDIERRSKRLHCAVIGCEEERPRSDMNLLYRKSRLDWRQRDQEGSKKRWVDQLTGALHVWDYNGVRFSGNINLLAGI